MADYRRRRTVTLLLLLLRTVMVAGSEFPERECCDSLPDPPPSIPHQGGSPPSTEGPPPTTLEENPPPYHSPEHPDPNNFLFPEFIPELSLDLGYPIPPPPPPLHPHHQPPDFGNNVPTTTGTGKEKGKKHDESTRLSRYIHGLVLIYFYLQSGSCVRVIDWLAGYFGLETA